MSKLTDYGENKIIDALFRGQPLGAPTTWHMGFALTTRGPRANTTAYALNDTISVAASDGQLHLYKCTTAGTSAASQPSYPGVAGEAITDGSAVFTEQTAEVEAGTAIVEPSGGAYARAAVTASLANFAGTQSAGSTTASTGTGGQTSNNAAINWPSPSGANWGQAWAHIYFDASSGGKAWVYAPLATAKTINDGDAAPSIAAGAATFTLS